ncbi:hypothetical protein [Lacinutrix sp. 5H-3-7-4]|uniref:hypothetical protein n=1 Tax=Lacinutrix sp. (strain 5H-3-7-4) TaxID=983544 RepID=UPI00020A38C8|nr:hypothetical protein [Lacinutrix sp. 5H-3-7-4]AEH01191.1 hypothetical protein Lacal_1343 [Lacinutrix sp. 5H-3-7-4]
MTLQILENNGVFYLEGDLIANTTRSFIIYFEYKIKTMEAVTVNIEKLNLIDKNGVAALTTLLANALREENKFVVTGIGCKDIYEDFNYQNVA